jgi:hypothetical protein
VLFYADNMKRFLSLRDFQDCLKIQSDLNKLVDWCGANSLELNVGMCKSITFLRLCHHVEFSYMLRSIILDRIDSITDLGVVMDSRMPGGIGKMLAMFVNRLSGEFRDPYTLRALYVSLVVCGGLFMTCTSVELNVCR